jgi:small-conductance mechanosensitive channel
VITVFNRFVVKVAEKRLKVKRGRLVHVTRFFQLIVYSIAIILILWTFNIDVTGLVAGLGIGALVIGFALKEIIENWVSGLIIISGKTYEIGDVITIVDLTGVVTDINLRTTRLKTYDRNEIIIPNSLLLRDKIVNLTSGKGEAVVSLISSIDYIYNTETVKQIIESILKLHPNVVVDEKRRREIRFIVRIREWTTEIETLFWITKPDKAEFIKSELTESLKRRFEEETILPPIPSIIRREFIESIR